MKKLLALILAMIMAFSMVACGGSESNEGGEVSGEGTVDSQPVGKVENNYDITKLSTFGLPEPSFTYTLNSYREMNKRDENDEVISTHPLYYFSYSADRDTTYAYMAEVQNTAGWETGDLPYGQGKNFRYQVKNENYFVTIAWGEDSPHCYIHITDYTKNCVYDESLNIYPIVGLEQYNEYYY